MAVPIPRPLIEFVLLGPLDDRRQLQDSPILGDVWMAFGQTPDERLDLLIVPYRTAHPGEVAGIIEDAFLNSQATGSQTNEDPLPTWEQLQKVEGGVVSNEERRVAYLQGLVAARLTFLEMLSIVVPKTRWWIRRWPQEKDQPEGASGNESKSEHEAKRYLTTAEKVIDQMLGQAKDWHSKQYSEDLRSFPSFERFLILMGLILWAGECERPTLSTTRTEEQIQYILEKAEPKEVARHLVDLIKKMLMDDTRELPLVWQISLNRRAVPALSRSVPAVKADAAKTLFNVDCSSIGWAIIDSGIHGSHPAFMKDGSSRVKQSFDFKNFRRVVSLSNDRSGERRQNLAILLRQDGLLLTKPIREGVKHIQCAEKEVANATAAKEEAIKLRDATQPPNSNTEDALRAAATAAEAAMDKEKEAIKQLADIKEAAAKKEAAIIKDADDALAKLAADARRKAPIHWELVEKFVAIDPGTKPQTNHGTHVAGIIGASKETAAADPNNKNAADGCVDGMCPDISLFDFRVLGATIRETEFAIIAALQFIRHLNERDALFTIHGANLSLSIPHDVRNFACGRTPICDECERLIASGVVVVAAAGNHGYKSFQTLEGSYDSYAAFSITDPGNAENVLTVGATHRFWPHTYGVSFFSSRGPTGDGRIKPDLVAPGERIHSTFPDNEWGELDGTSMAAPHVSGAAAMLLARYSELIRQPLRVKRILCDSATDLGRERSFQGHGMLDVLRAFQSI